MKLIVSNVHTSACVGVRARCKNSTYQTSVLLFSGEARQTGRAWAQEGRGAQTYGGSVQIQEGQERFHDTRQKEET